MTLQILQNKDILRALTDNLPDMLWIKDLEGRYLFANKAICDNLLMAKDTNEPLGKTDIFFALRERKKHPDNPQWHTFGELCINSDEITAKAGKPMRFEEYGNVQGKLLYLEVHKAPFYDDKGNMLGVLGSGRDITEQVLLKEKIKAHQQELEYRAQHDELTGLPNRVLIMDRLEHALQMARRQQSRLGLLFIDLDQFKDINDIFGHDVGDQVLQQISLRLGETIRESDTLARLGGDEFVLLVEQIQHSRDLSHLAEKLLETIAKPLVIDKTEHRLTASIGIATNDNPKITPLEMLKHADSAMYQAKEEGKNTHANYRRID